MLYTNKLRNKLFGTIKRNNLIEYINIIKNFDKIKNSKECLNEYNYINKKKELQKKHNMLITINPKISRTNKRVQCSISYKIFNKLIYDKFINKNIECKINNIKIKTDYISEPRKRKVLLLVYNLKLLCKNKNIKKYSNKRKHELIEYIYDKLHINNNELITLIKSIIFLYITKLKNYTITKLLNYKILLNSLINSCLDIDFGPVVLL